MRIKKKLHQHRRDFTALYECDWDDCNGTKEGNGYGDVYFHSEVIPTMPCPKCGRVAQDSTPKTAPDVAAGVVI